MTSKRWDEIIKIHYGLPPEQRSEIIGDLICHSTEQQGYIHFLEKCRADLLCDMASARQEIKKLAKNVMLNHSPDCNVDGSNDLMTLCTCQTKRIADLEAELHARDTQIAALKKLSEPIQQSEAEAEFWERAEANGKGTRDHLDGVG